MSALSAFLLLSIFTAPAHAGVSVGAGVALSADLADSAALDPTGEGYTSFGVGPSLQIPIRLELTPMARLRLTARADYASGSDRVTWTEGGTHFYDIDGHEAFLAAGALTLGPELVVPGDLPVTPYLSAGAGMAWVGTYHSFTDPALVDIIQPDASDLSGSGSLDPYTAQPCFIADLGLGVERDLSEGLALWVEVGYSVAFVDKRPLVKTIPQYQAMRSAYGWNALRGGIGVAFRL